MNRFNLAMIPAGLLALAFSLGFAAAQDETKSSTPPTAPQVKGEATGNADILQTGARLLTEERRQSDVRRRTTKIAARIGWLLKDLDENGLLEEGGGKELNDDRKLLKEVGEKDVPNVRIKLRNARHDLNSALPHIKGAEDDIKQVISRLDEVIDGVKTILVDNRLLKEITEIIRDEERVKNGTKEWGRQNLVNPGGAKLDRSRLSRAQESTITRYTEFFALLVKSREATGENTVADGTTGSRFSKAEKTLLESKPELAMSNAVDQILNTKAGGAVEDQEKAIEALRAAQQILAADESSFDDLVNAIEQLIAAQKELREDTETPHSEEARKKNEFQSQKSQLEARQIGIGTEIVSIKETHLPNYEPRKKSEGPSAPVDKPGETKDIFDPANADPFADADPFAAPKPGELPFGVDAEPTFEQDVGDALVAAGIESEKARKAINGSDQNAAVITQLKVIEILEGALAAAQAAEAFAEEGSSDDGFGDDGFGDDGFGDDGFGDDGFGDDGFGDDGFGDDGFGDDGFG
ncbi:MAG: hypothetical protein VCA55_01220, partial [Verrucomicrobiales bacterium]